MRVNIGDRVKSLYIPIGGTYVQNGELGTVLAESVGEAGEPCYDVKWDRYGVCRKWRHDLLTRVEPKKMPREEILEEARNTVMGEREDQYGSPESNFAIIAKLYEAAEIGKNGWDAIEVARSMVLFKSGRLVNDRTHHDSLVDGIGYFANWHECVTLEKEGDDLDD